MVSVLSQNPLLTIFLVVALGAIIGHIPLGPVRFGAAGALFVGLALSAAFPALGEGMELLQAVGLVLFVYTVGISAGGAVATGLRKNLPLLLACAAAVLIAAGATVAGGKLTGLDKPLVSGLFTGALTAAPALDTAARLSSPARVGVGYALAYPLAVVLAIILASIVATRKWPGHKDTPSLAGAGPQACTVLVKNNCLVRKVPGYVSGQVRLSYLRRGKTTRVVAPGEELQAGDRVVVVGNGESSQPAIDFLGTVVPEHLADDRTQVEFERITVSNAEVAGRSVADINLPVRFGAVITRVRRGDLVLLASDDLVLEPGDRVSVVAPREELDGLYAFLGDSERKVSEVDALGLGVGLVLGLLAGLVQLPLGGGVVFSLGPAAGPLLVGMALGALRRTGPIIWLLPQAANLTIRQLGLLFFLAALGLVSGPEFASLAFSLPGLKAGLVTGVAVLASCGGIALYGRFAGLSAGRTAGAVAGLLGQPAVLSAAQNCVKDERVENAYATLFAWGMIVKIALVPLVFLL